MQRKLLRGMRRIQTVGCEWRRVVTAIVILGLGTVGVGAERESSAPGSLKNEGEESREDLRQRIKALQESLMLANSEVDYFRQEWQAIRLRVEALGVDALTADEKRLQERVVQAVRELYQTERERRDAVGLVEKLLTAGQNLIKTAQHLDPDRRAAYEEVVRSARAFLSGRGGGNVPVATNLKDGQIVGVNPELNCVVINVGSSVEARVGMPFRVFRESRLIGRVKVLQTRERVSAAVIEGVEKGKELKIGDRVSVAAEK